MRLMFVVWKDTTQGKINLLDKKPDDVTVLARGGNSKNSSYMLKRHGRTINISVPIGAMIDGNWEERDGETIMVIDQDDPTHVVALAHNLVNLRLKQMKQWGYSLKT